MVKSERRKPNIVGWSLNDITQKQIKKLAVHFRLKKVKALHKIFDILFNELQESEDFKKFALTYDSIEEREIATETSIYASYDIDKNYMRRFKEVMYRFEFVDRSPFLRMVIDYVFQKYCAPVINMLPKIRKDLENNGYVVKNIIPALLGDVFIQIENPAVKK